MYIISLGEIVTQNQMNMLVELAKLINKADTKKTLAQLGETLNKPETKECFEQFRQGAIAEDEFVNAMCFKIKEATNFEISKQDFYAAWNKMNPTYSDFSSILTEVVEASQHYRIVFISNTNPIDIKHLITELRRNSVPHTVDANRLTSIYNIPVYFTCVEKKSKADLILQLTQPQSGEKLNYSNSFFDQTMPSKMAKATYVYGVRKNEDPIYQVLAQKSNHQVKNLTESSEVQILVWNRSNKQTIIDAIECAPGTYQLPVKNI